MYFSSSGKQFFYEHQRCFRRRVTVWVRSRGKQAVGFKSPPVSSDLELWGQQNAFPFQLAISFSTLPKQIYWYGVTDPSMCSVYTPCSEKRIRLKRMSLLDVSAPLKDRLSWGCQKPTLHKWDIINFILKKTNILAALLFPPLFFAESGPKTLGVAKHVHKKHVWSLQKYEFCHGYFRLVKEKNCSK